MTARVSLGARDDLGREQGQSGVFLVRSGSDIAKHHSMAPGCLEMHHRSGASLPPSIYARSWSCAVCCRAKIRRGLFVVIQRKGVCV